MASKHPDLHQLPLQQKPDAASDKATAVAVWILMAILYLMMGAALYVIWQRAGHG